MNYSLVLQIDSAEESKMALVLRNANNYLNALPGESFELVIVANGPGVALFTSAYPDFEKTAAALAQKGVKFRMCANALAEKAIPKEALWPFCEITPAGLVEIVRLQRAGFAYIKP